MTDTVQSELTVPWAGHYRATSAVFQAVLERAVCGCGHASLSDRVLASVCEFRAMTANGELGKHLMTGAIDKLGEARFALNQIGAMAVAAIVSTTIDGLERTLSSHQEDLMLQQLERDLLAVGRSLDESIARYAQCLQDNGRRAAPAGRRLTAMSDA